MAPTTRSSKNVFVTTCFLLAALIAFQITRKDPEITASFNHADVATAHDGVYRNVSALDASAKTEAHHVDAQQLQAESGAALPVEIANQFDHEETLKTAQNVTYSFKLPAKRTSTLDPTKTFSFVHISKAAGATWIRTLLNLQLDVCPKAEAGKEYPVWHQDHVYCKNSDYHLLSLRSPRHHVWSQFTECKYDDWGLRVTRGLGFPRTGNKAQNDETDFNDWLDHFLPMDENHQDNYKCYHPANFQTRYLESKVSAAHGVKNRPNGTLRFEGNITRATSTYYEQDFVPIVELHHESLCIFYFRLGANAPKKAMQYLNAQCVCPKPMAVDENLQMVHVVHHENGHRKELRSLDEDILQKIQILTRVDSDLYVLALRQFLVEIAWLESSDGIDRQVLCHDVIRRLEPELEYLNVSVLQLYEEAKSLVGG